MPDQIPTPSATTAGFALLARLKALGVDYVFANSGTDFPPIIEALAETGREAALPQAIVMPHEHAAMGMAHGYYLASGRVQAVMAHTNVGLANCAIGAINAATERVPLLLFSGRTPVLEAGRFGARTVPIGWGQEMRDQAALVRESVKWDYELRFPEQAAALVDRARAIALSTPKGPVYVSLPREVLGEAWGEPAGEPALEARPAMQPVRIAPDPDSVREAARLLAAARRPLIIAQRGAGSPSAFDRLARLAHDWAIPVSQYWAVQLAIPTDHPMAAGSDPAPFLAEADLVLALDSLAPWSPAAVTLSPGCRVIQAGPDPLFARTPIRNFPADLCLAGETDDIIHALSEAMGPPPPDRDTSRTELAARCRTIRAAALDAADRGARTPMSKAWVSRCLSRALAGRPARILSELGCPLEPLTVQAHGSWFQEPHSGGLGWSFPAALGMALADPERPAIATMGDGSYVFANPVACHQIAEALALPVLVLVLNNRGWGAVRQSVLSQYPEGHAARANRMPLVSLDPSPDFTRVAQASRAWTARVDDPAQLEATIAAALAHITTARRQALVEIAVEP